MERRKPNFLQKLYSREIHGSFYRGRQKIHNKAIKLFGGKIPERFYFFLQDMFGRRSDHILVGTTRCGQFLITYTYSFSSGIVRDSVNMHYKYRLHWWAFPGGVPAHKVAEVQLFDTTDVKDQLHVGIAQWPGVNDKLVVYGYSEENDHAYLDDAAMSELDSGTANRMYFITVTTLPSLHNCRDCKAVAESFDEEDMAASWDRAISFSCLKHGLTIHTTLDVAPPYPIFDPITSLKMDYRIIINTGSFLHVLNFNPNEELKASTENETIVPDEISHRIGEMLSGSLKHYQCPWKASGETISFSTVHRKSLPKSINNAWHNTIMDKANKVYAFEESEDGCEPRFKWFKKRRLADKMYEFCSDDEDMENKCPPKKMPRYFDFPLGTCEASKAAMMKLERKLVVTDFSVDAKDRKRPLPIPGETIKYPDAPLFFKNSLGNYRRCKSEQYGMCSKVGVPNSSICDNEVSNKCDKTMNKTGSLEISDSANFVPQQNPVDSDNQPAQYDIYDSGPPDISSDQSSSLSDPTLLQNETNQPVVDTLCRSTQNLSRNCNKPSNASNTHQTLASDGHPVSSTSESKAAPSKSDQTYHSIPPLDISIINPDLSAILAEWEAESVSSLSPRSSINQDPSLSKNDVIQSFLELIPGMTISPRSSLTGLSPGESSSAKVNDNAHNTNKVSSPNSSSSKYSPLLVVLRTRNCNQDKEPQKTKEQDDRMKAFSKEEAMPKVTVKPAKEMRMIYGCSVRFDRLYIELDDEIISTISTDVEDDDQETGFHCALPLSVHGSAYAQLQMVSRQKAEKLSMKVEQVFQSSFDIEQFCFKAADIICQCEGFKFWFCSDYDVELIDVCAFNSDILGVLCMRVNAEKKPPKTEMYSKVNQRLFYGMKCVFVWNPVADQCCLEAYTPLVETNQVGRVREAPARREAERVRHSLDGRTLFTLPPYPPIRSFEHRMWKGDVLSPSIDEIRDYKNLMGLRMKRGHIQRRYVTEYWD